MSVRHCVPQDFAALKDLKSARISSVEFLKFDIYIKFERYRVIKFYFEGDRRDLNPQPPVPQTGALPLSYDHHI